MAKNLLKRYERHKRHKLNRPAMLLIRQELLKERLDHEGANLLIDLLDGTDTMWDDFALDCYRAGYRQGIRVMSET